MARGRPRKSGSRGGRATKTSRKSTGRKSNGTSKTPAKSGNRFAVGEKRPWEYSDDEDFEVTSNLSDLATSDVAESRESDLEDEDYEPSGSVRASASPALPADDAESFCGWDETSDDQLPHMDLPQCSMDLLVEGDLLFDTLEIYETCRTYYRIIQISPFLFEDFCSALRSPEQTKLLAEIHIAFLRLLFRDDEDEQTVYSVQADTNNSFNVMLQLLEPMTYGEVLRQYAESDPRFPKEVLDMLQGTNYPFVDSRSRLTVLKFLCGRLFETIIYKKVIKNEGKFIYDAHCRECGKPGDLLLCDGCEACYHVECAKLKEVPEGSWLCEICELHKIPGVIDCLNPGEVPGRQAIRLKPMGVDRHGRMYWFIARRLFIQDNSNGVVYYYSTLPQIYELVSKLDPEVYEKRLCRSLLDYIDSIANQMRITVELTDRRRNELIQKISGIRELPESYLHVDNGHRMSEIVAELVGTSNDEDGGDTKFILLQKVRNLLSIEGGHLTETVWTGGMTEKKLLTYHQELNDDVKVEDGEESVQEKLLYRLQRGFRLGFSDGYYRNYVNQYSVNELAKSPYLRAKERDKTKYLSTRFALMDEGEFEWFRLKNRDMFANAQVTAKFIQVTVRKLTERIPDELMHRLWRNFAKQRFLENLQAATSVESLKHLLLQFERAIRKPVFSIVWWNSLGHTKLLRVTADDREKRQKVDFVKKKEERALSMAEFDDLDVIWVKYRFGGAPKHNIWKLKDEQYRVNGKEALGGWMWTAKTWKRRFVGPPERPPRNVTADTPAADLTTGAAKKAHRLDNIIRRVRYDKLVKADVNKKTETEHSGKPENGLINGHGRHVIAPHASNGVVVRDPRNVPGEGKPFPFPKPYSYMSRGSHERSILVLPQPTLRKLARTGGLDAQTFIFGFQRQAKSNFLVWPYPCPRPLFDNCWRYMTLNASSLHAVSLQLRIMYACIRWADMEPDEDDIEDPRVVTHMPDYDERRTVIGHKENPPDGYYEQYKLRMEQFSLDDYDVDDDDGDNSTNYRSGHRSSTRKKKRPLNIKKNDLNMRKKTKVYEQMIDGVALKLYEIRNYWEDYYNKRLAPPPSSVRLGSTPTGVRVAPKPSTSSFSTPRQPYHIQPRQQPPIFGESRQRVMIRPSPVAASRFATPSSSYRYVPATTIQPQAQTKIVVRTNVDRSPIVVQRDPQGPPQGYYIVRNSPHQGTPHQNSPATVYRRSVDQPDSIVNSHHSNS